MKFQQKPHKKTKDKKSFIEKLREEEQKKMDRLIKTNDKENEDGNLEEKWIQITYAHQRIFLFLNMRLDSRYKYGWF